MKSKKRQHKKKFLPRALLSTSLLFLYVGKKEGSVKRTQEVLK